MVKDDYTMATRWHQDKVVTMIRQTTTTNIIAMIIGVLLVTKSDCTCNSDQYNSCLHAAVDGSMTSLAGGGVCQSKPYIQFTHVCSVKNYMPTVDYCCCMLDGTGDSISATATPSGRENTIVMCCRYHQDWNHFRCQEPDDVVHSTPMVSGVNDGLLPTGMLITMTIVGSVIIVAFCIMCCIKCCCYRYEGDSQLWCCHYCVQDVGEVSVPNRDSSKPVKPVQTSSVGELFSEDDLGSFYEQSDGNIACTQYCHHYNDHPYHGHPTHPYHLHYHHHHHQHQQQQQQHRRGISNHPSLDRTMRMASPTFYDSNVDHTQSIDSAVGGPGSLDGVTRTCCVPGVGVPCAGPVPTSATCACSALFSPAGCGLNHQALPHHAPTSWCTCTEQLYAAAMHGCSRRTSFYRRHIERQQQQTSSRSSSTYSRLSRRHSRTRAANAGPGGYYLPHETDGSASEAANDLCFPTVDSSAISQQLVPAGGGVDRKDSDVIIDGCGGRYAAGLLHWQAIILQPTTNTSLLFSSSPNSKHAPRAAIEPKVLEVKDVVQFVAASAPPEQEEVDGDGNVDNGIDSGNETKIVGDQT